MLSPSAYWLVLLSVAVYAAVRGRYDERLAVAICVAGTVATLLARLSIDSDYQMVETGVFVVDILALCGFVGIALMSKRFWPLWVAGFQLTSLMSHGLKLVHSDMVPRVYAAAERFWIYPIFLAIVLGTYRSARRSASDSQSLRLAADQGGQEVARRGAR